jgi:hypothetical protein
MAKNLRQNVQAGHHGAGTHKKKVGAKKKTGGKQRVADRDKACVARKAAAWALKVPTIIATLKTERGESLTASSSRMVLIVTMNVVNDRGIIIEKGKRNIKGIDGAFAEAARMTSVGRETIRAVFYSWVDSDYETFNVGDPTIRGSGSPLVDRQTVRKLTIMQTKAIGAFIEHRNSSAAARKVTLDEISKYMQEGPGEDASAPALSEDLRVRIPRSSLRYVLIHCLGYRHGYTKKKVDFKEPKKRHLRVRRFIIEMDRALKLQDGTYISGKFEVRGNYVIVFTDETYIHQNHSPLTSWTKDGTTGKTTSKGKRLVVLNAITMDDFVVARDAEGFPIKEESIKKGSVMDSVPTAEWIWPANSTLKDYHDNMDGDGFERWLYQRLIPAFEACYPNKKMILVMVSLLTLITGPFQNYNLS